MQGREQNNNTMYNLLVIPFLDVETMGLNGPENFHPNFLPAESDQVTTVA